MRQVTDAVAAAGRGVLAGVGYDALTLELVATEAGVEPDLVRHYFPDRDAVVDLVLERWDPADPLLPVVRAEVLRSRT